MGKYFEKLLLVNNLLTKEELEYYKTKLKKNQDLGELLLKEGLIDLDLFKQLKQAVKKSQEQKRIIKKQKRDKKVLEVVQNLGFIRVQELDFCIQEKDRQEYPEHTFLADLLVKKGYLTDYLVAKFYKKGADYISLPSGVKNYEALIIDIPKYLKNRLLAKIILKNSILSKNDIKICWEDLKDSWPKKTFSSILLEKNMINSKKLNSILKVLDQFIPKKYPHFVAQIRDTQLAKLLAKKKFLSPWRLNKCLLKQLEKINNKKYISLREFLVKQGYLTNYQFDTVLKQYGYLVTLTPPDFLVPKEDIKKLTRDEIENEIQEASSDVHLIIEEEDDDFFDFNNEKLGSEAQADDKKEKSEEFEEIQEESSNNLETVMKNEDYLNNEDESLDDIFGDNDPFEGEDPFEEKDPFERDPFEETAHNKRDINISDIEEVEDIVDMNEILDNITLDPPEDDNSDEDEDKQKKD